MNNSPILSIIVFGLWILAIWYWYRHYKIRGQNAVLGVLIAIVFSGLAIFAMIIDAPLRALFSKEKFGPCPNCGKTKLIRQNDSQADHVAQPICPNCKAVVGSIPGLVPASPSISKQIEELQELLTKGILSQEEFNSKKTELLKRM
jgi:hypothetical protein